MARQSLTASESTQAMASLLSAYGDDEADDEVPPDTDVQPATSDPVDDAVQHSIAHFISDDEDRHSTPEKFNSVSPSESPKLATAGQSGTATLPAEDDYASRSPPRKHVALERKPTKQLVSYVSDDDVDEDASHSDDDTPTRQPAFIGLQTELEMPNSVPAGLAVSVNQVDAEGSVTGNHSPYNVNESDIQLPPEPTGNCSKHLQAKVATCYSRIREGKDMNYEIQKRKDFRNPSIYEKLVKFCGIDEQGTNYPPELYNPLIWGPQSYYDELARIQTEWLHEKEKEAKKSKVEFQKGVRKTTPSDAPTVDTKRKSKWDERTGPGSGGPALLTHGVSVTKSK